MLNRTCSLIGLVFLFVLAILSANPGIGIVNAESDPTPGPNRFSTVSVDKIEYKWWLVYWVDNSIACSFTIEREGKPSGTDILKHCNQATYDEWADTKACTINSPVRKCTGMYLHNIGSKVVKQEVEIELPAAQIWLTITGCNNNDGSNICTGMPKLKFSGEETIPNERIIKIQGNVGDAPFSCLSNECEVPIPDTIENGIPISFWGDSSYGDSTIVYKGRVRAFPLHWGNSPATSTTNSSQYYADILSPQWKDSQVPSCALTWQAFPLVSGKPDWLNTPADVSGLESSISLQYLAAELIKNGTVNANNCSNWGLETSQTANQCGVETAQATIEEWQNQFNDEIFKISNDLHVPGQLIKNIFIHESQMWPGLFPNEELGLGQMTEDGADAALRWNPNFFSQFCPLVFSIDTCALGYYNIGEVYQSTLRGALLSKVDATCLTCSHGIDNNKAKASINYFAQTLIGNCNQVNQLLYNVTGREAGSVSTYEDLWRFTLINYNAGPGCLYTAVKKTWDANGLLDWSNVAANLEPACQGALNYVHNISEGNTKEITVSSLLPTTIAVISPFTSSPTLAVSAILSSTPTTTPSKTSTSIYPLIPMTISTFTLTMAPTMTPSITPTITPTSIPTATYSQQ